MSGPAGGFHKHAIAVDHVENVKPSARAVGCCRTGLQGKAAHLEEHLGERAEQFFADRMKRTVAMDRPLLLGADGFRYPEPLRYQEHDLEQELDLVAITRRQTARTLRLVAPDAWHRTAVHSETGLVTLRQLLLHAVNHLRHHLRFVAEKRAALGLS